MKNNKPTLEQIKALDRRSFIKASSLLSLGSFILPASVLGCSRAKPLAEQTGCAATTDDILGPYYLPGSPTTNMIAGPNEPGTRLFISGTVLSNDCLTPVPSATLELWQANDAAVYDTSQNFNLRGTVMSDQNGHYAIETIMPGPYLNGGQYRPKHIHYKTSKPGFPTLITQLYFQGDPYIAADPWAGVPAAAARIIPLTMLAGGALEGVFDVVLDGFVGVKPNSYGEDGDLMPVHPNPTGDLTNIHFNVFRKANVQVSITDTDGREVVTLIDDNTMAQGRYTTQWNGRTASGDAVADGMYLSVLSIDGRVIKSQRIVRGSTGAYGQ